VLATWSAQHSSKPQQGMNVHAVVIRSNMKTSQFFMRDKDKTATA
jgi:hypothetical protein